ncbi:Hypothetical protein DHA2_151458 [Giardia duodenalis]|uniref:Uncharacterized protein n=1 Tax=Giardia intestinalis TaxID=5741 RepID=V6TJR4_GIAIN|nr:Hypothetical protein DHA2_151458 [Giardia intestinalis]
MIVDATGYRAAGNPSSSCQLPSNQNLKSGMPPQFRFIQADPDEFDDLDGFDVDYAGVFNGVTAKYTNVVDDLDSLSLKQDPVPAEAKAPEKHRKRKKRSASSVKLTEEAHTLSPRSNKRDSNRSISAYSQQLGKEIEGRRSVSARSPSPQPKTAIQQVKEVSASSGMNRDNASTAVMGIEEKEEKKHRRRKVKKHTVQSYKNEPTPGPLTEHTNNNASLAEGDNKAGMDVSPINTWNPYKQGKTPNLSSAGFAISASPINRSIGSRGSHVEPYASSTPAIPELESFYADLPIELNDPGNNSLAKSIALDLSVADGAKETSVASELSLHEGLSEHRTGSSTKLSAHSPLSIHSALETKSLTSNIVGLSTPKIKFEGNQSVKADNAPAALSGHAASLSVEVADETISLRARIKELEDAQKEVLLQKMEEEKKSLLIEQSMLASRLEQERSKIADISYKIVHHSITASMVGEPETDTERGDGHNHMDQDLAILGPAPGADSNQGEIVLTSSSGRQDTFQETSKVQYSVVANDSKQSSAISTVKSSPGKSGLCLNESTQPIKSKSLHTRKRKKYIRSPSTSSLSTESSDSSTASQERYHIHRIRSKGSYRSYRRRSKSEYKYLYASIKEMEARQFELLDRIAELANETKTVRSIGTDSVPLGASVTSSAEHSNSGYAHHGSFPVMTPNFGMMSLPVMPMMPMVSPMCMTSISGAPYPHILPTTPLQRQIFPQYVTPPVSHQSTYPVFPYYNAAPQQQVPISNETAALISTVSHVMGTTSVRPSVRDTIKGIMTNYGLQN